MNKITFNNLEKYSKYEEHEIDEDDYDEEVQGFWIVFNSEVDPEETNFEEFQKLMFKEIKGDLGNSSKKSLFWANEIKRRMMWKQGETIYGWNREKHTQFTFVFSKNKSKIGLPDFVIDTKGFVSIRHYNKYTIHTQEEDGIDFSVLLRPISIHNDIIIDKQRVVEELTKKVKRYWVNGENYLEDLERIAKYELERIAKYEKEEKEKKEKYEKVQKQKEILSINSQEEDITNLLNIQFESAGLDKLATILKTYFNGRITNLKNSNIPLEKRKNLIVSTLKSKLETCDKETKIDILVNYFKEKNNKK